MKILLLVTTWLWAGYLIFREHFLKFEWDRKFLDPTVQPMINSLGIDRALMPIVLLGHYTALMFWPIHLSPDYGADEIGSVVRMNDPYVWIGGLAGAVLLLGLIASVSPGLRPGSPGQRPGLMEGSKKTTRFALFCLLCLGITYGVIGNVFTLIGTILAERIAYLPSAFVLILIAMLIARLPKKIGVAMMIVILTLSSIRTVTWARDWNDPLTLYRISLQNCPKSLQLHLLLAQEYHNAAREPEAQETMARATAMYPNYWQAWMQRASHALDVGRLDDAASYLQTAMKLQANPHLLVVRERLNRMTAARAKNLRGE